ncbi:MAG: J domain-containing protein [Candidatus Sericytochromatia bacterium]
MSHYDVLGISRSADRATVLAAYRRRVGDARSRVQHARLTESRREAERLLHEIEAARHVLGDPHRRLAYDLSLIPVAAPAGQGRAVSERSPEAPVPASEPTVRSVQWIDEPQRRVNEPPVAAETVGPPSTPFLEGLATPPPEPGPGWDRRWVWAIAGGGLLAFIVGLALVTGGLRPVMVGPPAPPTAAPLVTPVPEATVGEP